jgi:ABC-2 type transport system permease protein
MRILQFIKKEIHHVLSSPESLLLMVLFPFGLTMVLGLALSGEFSRVQPMPEVRLPIVAQGDLNSRLFIRQAESAGLTFEAAGEDDARRQVADGSVSGYVVLDGDGITYHTNTFSNWESLLVRTYGRIYAQQANMAALALSSGRLDKMTPLGGEYVRSEGIDTGPQPTSFGYYGVTMLTMIMMYGTMQAAGMMDLERTQRTYLRLKASPFSMNSVFLVKSFMSTLTLLLQALLLMAMNTMVFGVTYRNMAFVLLALAPYALFCNALGLAAWQMTGSARTASGLLNIVVVLLVFLGGGYVPVDLWSPLLAKLSVATPVGMYNKGLISYIYAGDSSMLLRGMAVSGALGAVLLTLAYGLFIRKGESHHAARA